jgi:hypothetical protein
MGQLRQGLGFIVGFLPWLIFWVVASPNSWEWAALAAFIASLVLAVPEAKTKGLKMIDYANIGVFAVFTLCAIFLDRTDLDWLEDYSMTISTFALAAIVLGSLAFDPFTAQYARDDVPEELWHTPTFVHINRTLTLLWGAVFIVFALCSLVGERSDSTDTNAIFQWVIPIAVLVVAIKFTKAYPDRYKAAHPPRNASP